MDTILALAKQVKSARKAQHIRQAEAAALAGINKNQWSRFESGKLHNPTIKTLSRIMEAVNLSLHIEADRIPF